MQMGFELRYVEVDGDIVSEEFPHLLRLTCTNPRNSAMTVQEFIALRKLCDEVIHDRDYFSLSRPQYFVAFRTKAQAMQIKLMWKPEEYKVIR
ncbi:hypothetical protein D3C71_1113070 [compost metagenome]